MALVVCLLTMSFVYTLKNKEMSDKTRTASFGVTIVLFVLSLFLL